MEDGYRLIDYGINVNDVIQLMIREAPLQSPVSQPSEEEYPSSEKEKKPENPSDEDVVDTICVYYEVTQLLFLFLGYSNACDYLG